MWYVQKSHKEQACLPVVSCPTNCDYSQANTVLQTLLPHLLCLDISDCDKQELCQYESYIKDIKSVRVSWCHSNFQF